ncbi:tRNA lysidine(34) synthetase TilS [Phenylobacterium conjunctum]|uniref:tRNA(Ile)-lysidine synthase n=1 Tax=Phenylobacterium conjunctum TaxID=1298959 RepID=A0ABW3T117_9CAUL
MRGLKEAVRARLDARLNPDSRAPLAVALSGGSDSLALTMMAAAWAERHHRRLLVLTVDHGLRPESAGWTELCAGHARRLGADFQAFCWRGDKPLTGPAAAARAARHALLADAARQAGASVILMGHTADDLAESAAMRAAGATTPDAREWSPSPVWPQGRGVFLLRPLLDQGRAVLRAWLAAQGETWIEDPANSDLRFARARARAAGPSAAATPRQAPDLRSLGRAVTETLDGGLTLPRQALRMAPPDAARAFVAACALSAAGTSSPPRGDRLDRLTDQLRGAAPMVATLAGARIEADGETLAWRREPGEFRRGQSPVLRLAPAETGVWDGRFEITANHALEIAPLVGRTASLAEPSARALRQVTASARGALPALKTAAGLVCPLLQPTPGVKMRALALARLQAACGLVVREP